MPTQRFEVEPYEQGLLTFKLDYKNADVNELPNKDKFTHYRFSWLTNPDPKQHGRYLRDPKKVQADDQLITYSSYPNLPGYDDGDSIEYTHDGSINYCSATGEDSGVTIPVATIVFKAFPQTVRSGAGDLAGSDRSNAIAMFTDGDDSSASGAGAPGDSAAPADSSAPPPDNPPSATG